MPYMFIVIVGYQGTVLKLFPPPIVMIEFMIERYTFVERDNMSST